MRYLERLKQRATNNVTKHYKLPPSGPRCAGGGSPWPCWWWRRCPAHWWGRPSRTDWDLLEQRTKIKLRTSPGESLPVDVGGNPGGLIPIIFLWAASGSRSGLEPCWERLGSDPNLRVVGSSGESKGALISGILGLVAGSPGEGGSVKFKYWRIK